MLVSFAQLTMSTGLATAAGAQLALTTDLPVALESAAFATPGASIGLFCTSPATAISRRLPAVPVYRMLATAKPLGAREVMSLGGLSDVVTGSSDEALDKHVLELASSISSFSGQTQAFGKWAFHTQLKMDGYEEAAVWAGQAMVLNARMIDAREGMDAFLEKRRPQWRT